MKLLKTFVMTSISLLTISALAAPDIVGNYDCKGTDPFSSKTPNYTNPVNVTKNGDTYSFQWLHANGYPYIYGTGVINKNISDTVAVVFWDPTLPSYTGIQTYKIGSDGSLKSIWTLKSGNQFGTETCTKKQ